MKILKDLNRYSKGSRIKATITIFFNQGFHSVALYRLSNCFSSVRFFGFLGKFFQCLNRLLYGVDIDYRATFAPGLEIVHGNGIVVGGLVKSEGPVILFQGVTLGNGGIFGDKIRVEGEEVQKQPVLGENVVIFPNSMILGPVKIGSNSYIGAGSVITEDIPDNVIAYNERSLCLKNKRK